MDGRGPARTWSALSQLAPLNREALALSARLVARADAGCRGPSPIARGATRGAAAAATSHAHYDLGNDFYRLFLDETLTYSSAVFDSPEQSLADAQRNKYRLHRRAGRAASAAMHVLEIGSGWGGFALYAAGELGCRVTTITISQAQHDLARERVAAAGLEDRVERRAARLPRHQRHVRRDRLDRDARGGRRGVLRRVLPRRATRARARRPDEPPGDHASRTSPTSRSAAAPTGSSVHLPGRPAAVAGGDRAVAPSARSLLVTARPRTSRPTTRGTLHAWRASFIEPARRGARAWASTSASSACGSTTSRSARPASRPGIDPGPADRAREASRDGVRGPWR